jgi:toxin-antitoxin system PIN domain toxin
MIVIDVNVLLAAHRSDHPHHADVSSWFVQATSGTERFTVPDFVWASFVRIATNRKVFTIPTPLDDVFAFVRAVRGQPAHIAVAPAESHLETFEELCRAGDATGDLANDAYLAAIAVELGATLVSLDRDFARFEALDWQRPREQ